MMTAAKTMGVILAATATLAAQSDGEVGYPTGFRNWTHISSAFIGEGHAAFPRYGGIHHIYANQRAMAGYRSGVFPRGSVMVFDVHDVKTGTGTIDAAGRKFIDVMEKRDNGWRFVEYDGDSRSKIVVNGAQAVSACAACHASAPRDHVFSRFE